MKLRHQPGARLAIGLSCGLAASLLAGLPAPARAGTSAYTQLCWAASGVEATMFSQCGFSSDGGTGQTLNDTTHTLANLSNPGVPQLFAGHAAASSTPNTWRVETSLSLSDYRRDSYIWTQMPDGSLRAATTAVAAAVSTDTVTITGGTGVFSLNFILSVEGTLASNSPLLSSSFCASVNMASGQAAVGGFCTGAGQVVPSTVTLSYSNLAFGAPITPTLTIGAYQFITPLSASQVASLGGQVFDASGSVSFGSTVHLSSLLVTDAAGNAIQGLSINSASGFAYPLDPQNTAPVPEPASALLLLGGLAGLGGLARRPRAAAGSAAGSATC